MPLIAAYPAAVLAARVASRVAATKAAKGAASQLRPAVKRLMSRLGKGKPPPSTVKRLMSRLGKGKPPPSSVPRSGPQVPTGSGMVRRGVGAARNPAWREPDQIAPEDIDAPVSPVNIRELYRNNNEELKRFLKQLTSSIKKTSSSKKPPIPTRKPKLASGLVIPTRKPLNIKNRG